MSISAESLRILHRLHRQVTDLRGRLARGPKQIKARKSNIELLATQLEEFKEKLKRTKLTISSKELSLQERENRILDVRAKLNACSSNKEYTAFVEQIAADDQANSVLSDEILELLDKATEDQNAVTSAEAEHNEANSQLEELSKKIQAERDGQETELGRVESDLRKSEEGLPAEVRQNYDRVAKAHGEEALAPLDGEVCGGCFQRVTPQMINELNLSQPVFCKSCGRLLYLSEDSTVV